MLVVFSHHLVSPSYWVGVMFLLKRKADGKWWNNSGDRHTDAWVGDPSKCRPFRSVNALRHSRACYGIHPPWNEPPFPWDDQVRKAHWAKVSGWFARSNGAGRTAYFNTLYEIVPVEVKMVIKS